MTEQLTTFVEMMTHLDFDAYVALPEPHQETFHKLRELRVQAQAGNNALLIQEIRNRNQPDELIRVFAAGMLVADAITVEQIKVLGPYLQADPNPSIRIALAKKFKAIPLDRAVFWLMRALVDPQTPQFRVIAAESIRDRKPKIAESVQDKEAAKWEIWKKTVKTLLWRLEKSQQYREYLDIAALVTAVTPPNSLIKTNDDRYLLADAFIHAAPKYKDDPRMTDILAALIIQSCGLNLTRAARLIDYAANTNNIPDDDIAPLRAAISSLLAPVELRTLVKNSYQKPLENLQKDARRKWQFNIWSAQVSLWLRVAISLSIAIGGLWLLYEGAMRLADTDLWPVSFLQIGLGLVLLLVSQIHRGWIRDTRQAFVDTSVANTVYAAFTQQRLDISHRYANLSLQNKLTAEEMQTANQLLGDAMKNAAQTLRNEKPPTLDDLLEQYS